MKMIYDNARFQHGVVFSAAIIYRPFHFPVVIMMADPVHTLVSHSSPEPHLAVQLS